VWSYKSRGLLGYLLKRRGKAAFLRSIAPHSAVLDVGCGNDSPVRFKSVRPDVLYVGVDVGDYNHTASPTLVADDYVLTSPELFAQTIASFSGKFDVVVSAHNLEHCNEPDRVLQAMVVALTQGGRIYLAFPCEASVHFPRRTGGCLNFNDDGTHRVPPNFDSVRESLISQGMRIDFAARRYRPALLFSIGLLLEPLAALFARTMPGGTTWALYGFESIIWATRPHSPDAPHG
jgi:SAM-dependent methyltransferase